MNRRFWLQSFLADIGMEGLSGPAWAAAAKAEIVLYCDLAVDTAKEAQMLSYFHTVFKPAAKQFEGYVDMKIMKLDHRVQGPKPAAGINYRFVLEYGSLALQLKWVNSPTHIKLWPGMAATLADPNFQVLVFNVA
jgi:hypothetical protein